MSPAGSGLKHSASGRTVIPDSESKASSANPYWRYNAA
jgi:hypothetical protein